MTQTKTQHQLDMSRDKDQTQIVDIYLAKSDKIFHCINNCLIALMMLIVIIPMLNVLASSFSSASAVNSGKVYLWPVEFCLDGYEKVFTYPNVWRSYGNTFFYTIVGTAINISMTLLAAYPLSRKSLPLRGFFTFLFTFTMMFSGGMIPTYLVMKTIGITNTRWAMLLPGAISIYNMLIARTFIQNIPEELWEAAYLDGCSDAKFFVNMVIPLSGTMISVLTLYYAVGHWNAYFNAFLYLTDRDMMPLQIVLRDVLLSTQIKADAIMDGDTAAALAGMSDLLKYSLIVVASVPILCLYPFLQKYFVKGVMIGSLKG
jgi:putative aldouronate transport system permease protein